MTTMTTAPAPSQQSLTAADRCDACGARAYAEALLESGKVLMFCSHHWGQHKTAVLAVSVDHTDETQRLVAEVEAMKGTYQADKDA